MFRKRDRQSVSIDSPPEEGHVRKDIRRPRFSFFRFNCQTAQSKQPTAHAAIKDASSSRQTQPGGSVTKKTKTRPQALPRNSAAVDERFISHHAFPCQQLRSQVFRFFRMRALRMEIAPHGLMRHWRCDSKAPQLSHNAKASSCGAAEADPLLSLDRPDTS